MKRLVALFAVFFSLATAGCGLFNPEEEPTIAGRYRLVRLYERICWCSGEGCCGEITAPGTMDGCQLDVQGYFHFKPTGNNPNVGVLEAETTTLNSCNASSTDTIDASYTYDGETLLLNDGEGEVEFGAILSANELVLTYADSSGGASIFVELRMVRD